VFKAKSGDVFVDIEGYNSESSPVCETAILQTFRLVDEVTSTPTPV
jgi:hypothetical protein